MRVQEIIRIIIIMVVGAAILFFVQPWLYLQGVLFLSDVDPEQWVDGSYIPAAILIFLVSLVSTGLWYVFAAKARPQRADETSTWRMLWWAISLAPVLSISAALYICRESSDALASLTLMYVFDILLMYWVSTASSSPGHTKHLPPGSFAIRRIFESPR